jgi:hypothetical protein
LGDPISCLEGQLSVESFERLQREITKAALGLMADSDFALAGSGAIREHGLISRPTEDIDLFTTNTDADSFSRNVGLVLNGLQAGGYSVEPQQQAERFARLVVKKDGLMVNIDLGVDWRDNEPIIMDIGPVLNIEDAVGNKAAALFSRSEARDFLDVDRIRSSGLYSDGMLLEMIRQRDLGFEIGAFVQQLKYINRLMPYQVNIYGVSAEQLEQVKSRFSEWIEVLENLEAKPTP